MHLLLDDTPTRHFVGFHDSSSPDTNLVFSSSLKCSILCVEVLLLLSLLLLLNGYSKEQLDAFRRPLSIPRRLDMVSCGRSRQHWLAGLSAFVMRV